MSEPKVLGKIKGMDTGEALELLKYHLGLREIYVGRLQRQLELAKAERDLIRDEMEYLVRKGEKENE